MVPTLKTRCQVIKVLKQPIIRVYNWTNAHHFDFYTSFPPIHQPLETRHFLNGSEERAMERLQGEQPQSSDSCQFKTPQQKLSGYPQCSWNMKHECSAQALPAAERVNKQQEFNQKVINTPQTQIMDNVPLNNLNKQLILSAVRKTGCRFSRTETKGMWATGSRHRGRKPLS